MDKDSNSYECVSCSWQGPHHDTDADFCPECGGECLPVDECEEYFDDTGWESAAIGNLSRSGNMFMDPDLSLVLKEALAAINDED